MPRIVYPLIGLFTATLIIYAIVFGAQWLWNIALPKGAATVNRGLDTAIEWTDPNTHPMVEPFIRKHGG